MKRSEICRAFAWIMFLGCILTGWVAHENAIAIRESRILHLQLQQWKSDSTWQVEHPKAAAWDSMQAKCQKWADLMKRLKRNP